jgi:hypothetical protein
MQSFATVGNSVTARAFQGGGMRAARRVADRLLVFGVIASTTLAASTWLAREHLPRLFTSDVACHLACQPAFLPVCLMVRTPLAHDSLPSSGARSDASTLSGGDGKVTTEVTTHLSPSSQFDHCNSTSMLRVRFQGHTLSCT